MLNFFDTHIIERAIIEDVGSGDITTENLVEQDRWGTGFAVAKEPLIMAGLEISKQVFEYFDKKIIFSSKYKDGDALNTGDILFKVEGSLYALLVGERTALNFLQRLSGIATNVRSYVNEIKGKKVRLVDTRKTTPGLRILEKYAVRMGGACNHRKGLYDGVLIKDNHIAVCGGIMKSVEKIRGQVSHLVKIEVEVSDMAGVKEALDSGADVIMLDNMDVAQIKEAVAFIAGRALVEVSGNITRKDLVKLADTGVDIISSGSLTHSARNVDISLRID